jgi:hypothetical protein
MKTFTVTLTLKAESLADARKFICRMEDTNKVYIYDATIPKEVPEVPVSPIQNPLCTRLSADNEILSQYELEGQIVAYHNNNITLIGTPGRYITIPYDGRVEIS